MKRVRVIILAAIVVALAAGLGGARPIRPRLPKEQDRSSPYMRVFGVTQPPYGFVQFCERMPEECRQGPPEEQRFSATPERLSELDALNRAVNREIAPATDMEIYGVSRILDHPDHQGRLRGLCAAEAQAPDRARLARERAADDGGARREGRGPRRADRAHGAGRFHPRQQGRRGEVVEPHPLRVHHAAVLSQPAHLDVARPARGQFVACRSPASAAPALVLGDPASAESRSRLTRPRGRARGSPSGTGSTARRPRCPRVSVPTKSSPT